MVNKYVKILLFPVVLSLVAAIIPSTIADGDMFWHLFVGGWILSHGIPHTLIGSWTLPHAAWIDAEWGGEVLMFLISKIGGVALVSFFLPALLLTLTYVYVDGKAKPLIVTLIVLMVGFIHFLNRPYMIADALYIVEFMLLRKAEVDKRWLFAIPLVVLVGANINPEIILAPGILLLWMLFRKDFSKTAIYSLVLSALAILAMPYPNGVIVYTLNTLAASGFIQEWGAPNLTSLSCIPALALFLYFVVSDWRKWPFEAAVALGGFILLLHSIRFLDFFAVMSIPLMTKLLPDGAVGKSLVVTISTLFTIGLIGTLLVTWPEVKKGESVSYPVTAWSWIKEHKIPDQKIINYYGWGGWIIDHGGVAFIDGRSDVYYRHGVLGAYVAIQKASVDTPEIMRKYGATCLLFPSSNNPEQYEDMGLRLIYKDSAAEILCLK